MNYLFLMTLLFFSNSCTNYNPLGNNGSEEESEKYYLELDFHQGALAYEDDYLRILMLAIQEEMEDGNNERRGLFEESQARRALIEELIAGNNEILFRGPIGPGGRPPRCVPDDEVFQPCPLPKSALDNLYLSTEQFPREKSKIEFYDERGRLVGQMQGMTEVPESEGAFVKAEMEYDSRSAFEVRITKLDFRGEFETTIYRFQE